MANRLKIQGQFVQVPDVLDAYACAALQRLLTGVTVPLTRETRTAVCAQAWAIAQTMLEEREDRPVGRMPDVSTSSPAGDVHTARALLAEVSRKAQLLFDNSTMSIEADAARIPIDLLERIRSYLMVAGS